VFALQNIKKDTILFSSNGKNIFISWKEVPTMKPGVKDSILSLCLSDENGFYLNSPFSKINCSYYVNHSSSPNCHHDLNNDIYYAIRDIEEGEELTCYYLPEERDWDEN
jgi:SET domain-containing protein